MIDAIQTTKRLCLFFLATSFVVALGGFHRIGAQPAEPPPPDKYKVELRYHINSPREQRVVYYKQLIDRLKKLGFDFQPALKDLPATAAENVNIDRIRGVVAGKNGPEIANIPFVATVLLVPEKFALPQKIGSRVLVQFDLAAGFDRERQRVFQDQTRALLQYFGFVESVGYDRSGAADIPFSRLRGTIPADQLPIVLKDLRSQPSGWFAPRIQHGTLPLPFAQVNPIRVITVLPDTNPPGQLPLPPGFGQPGYKVIGPRLWKIVQQKKPHTEPVRVEIIFKTNIVDENSLRIALQKTAPALNIEDILGNTVTGVFGDPYIDIDGQVKIRPTLISNQVLALAAVDFVAAIRLPSAANIAGDAAVRFPADNAKALQQSGVSRLHQAGHRGRGVKVAVADSDFRGYQAMMAQGRLPKSTRLLDMTIERNHNLLPDPIPGDPKLIGHGTQCAMAVTLAAPEADLILVRIDPAAPYMLARIPAYISGDLAFSPGLLRRHDEIQAAGIELDDWHKRVLAERRIVLDNFADESADMLTYQSLGVVRSWLFTTREWNRLRWAEFEKARRKHLEHEKRLLDYVAHIRALKGVKVISNSLVWNRGYPLGGRSALTQNLDNAVRPNPQPHAPAHHGDLPVKHKPANDDIKPIWLQAAGNTRGQTWCDNYRDTDANGVLEFAPVHKKLPPGVWTPELNFVGWLPYEQEKIVELPAATTLHVSLQWSEPHDPAYFFSSGDKDWYDRPLAEMSLLVLRQRDPEAKVLPADAFEVVAVSDGWPVRLHNTPNSTTYEISTEWTTNKPGRYAIWIERQTTSRWVVEKTTGNNLQFRHLTDLAPIGISPLGAPILPALEKKWQLRPSLIVEAVSGAEATKGRPVLRDFYTEAGSVGMPADGRELVAVGAAAFNEKAEVYGALGPPPFLDLFISPRVFSYDRLGGQGQASGPAYGTSLSASFAAGMSAATLSAGRSQRDVFRWLHPRRRTVLKMP